MTGTDGNGKRPAPGDGGRGLRKKSGGGGGSSSDDADAEERLSGVLPKVRVGREGAGRAARFKADGHPPGPSDASPHGREEDRGKAGAKAPQNVPRNTSPRHARKSADAAVSSDGETSPRSLARKSDSGASGPAGWGKSKNALAEVLRQRRKTSSAMCAPMEWPTSTTPAGARRASRSQRVQWSIC